MYPAWELDTSAPSAWNDLLTDIAMAHSPLLHICYSGPTFSVTLSLSTLFKIGTSLHISIFPGLLFLFDSSHHNILYI